MNGSTPKPSTLSGELRRIADLVSKMEEEEMQKVSFKLRLQDVKAKLGGLGVYDLKGLAVGLSILNSEAGKFEGIS